MDGLVMGGLVIGGYWIGRWVVWWWVAWLMDGLVMGCKIILVTIFHGGRNLVIIFQFAVHFKTLKLGFILNTCLFVCRSVELGHVVGRHYSTYAYGKYRHWKLLSKMVASSGCVAFCKRKLRWGCSLVHWLENSHTWSTHLRARHQRYALLLQLLLLLQPTFKAGLDGAEVSVSGWGSGSPWFKSHPSLISQSW